MRQQCVTDAVSLGPVLGGNESETFGNGVRNRLFVNGRRGKIETEELKCRLETGRSLVSFRCFGGKLRQNLEGRVGSEIVGQRLDNRLGKPAAIAGCQISRALPFAKRVSASSSLRTEKSIGSR